MKHQRSIVSTMKFKYSLMLVAMLFAIALCASTSRAQSSQVVLHYKDVVGTYQAKVGSVFSIDRAPQGMLAVEFQGFYPYRMANGKMSANTGVAGGTAKLIGDTALFTPVGTTGCTITLVFKPRKLIVTQQGNDSDCGFGHNVNASDTYKLTSRSPEHYDEGGAPSKNKSRRSRSK